MKWGETIAEHADRIATIETGQNGKLFAEMRAQARIAQDWLYYFGGLADKIEGTVIPLDRQSIFNYTLREPLGVVGVITPWNSPTFIAIMSLAPALAAGNTIVLEAVGDHVGLVDRAGAAGRRGRHPARRHQRRHRLPRDRRGAGRSSAGREGVVHRQRRRRPRDRGARGSAARQLHARARRQEPEHRVRRREPGSGRSGRAGGHLRGGGADLRRRLARLHPALDLRRSSSIARARVPSRSRSATRCWRRRRWGRSRRRCSSRRTSRWCSAR